MPPTMREDEETNWNENLHPYNYMAKVQLQVSPSKPPLGLAQKQLGQIKMLT